MDRSTSIGKGVSGRDAADVGDALNGTLSQRLDPRRLPILRNREKKRWSEQTKLSNSVRDEPVERALVPAQRGC